MMKTNKCTCKKAIGDNNYCPVHGFKSMPEETKTACDCGWDGQGTGPNGKFVKGDRCPNCGAELG